MADLKDFLSTLATDPQRLGEFIQDPERAMTDAELSDEDKNALRSGFPAIIWARLAGIPTERAFQITLSPSEGQQQFPQFQFQQQFPQFQFQQQFPQFQFQQQFPQFQFQQQFPQFQFPPPPQFPQFQFPPPQFPQFQFAPQQFPQFPPQGFGPR